MSIIEELHGKRILIWGYGREGKSSERFLKEHCSYSSLDIYEGKREGIEEEKYDCIIKSPGIYMEEENPKYTSQTELFLRQFRDQVIGITGTKGKSTTSSMLYKVLIDSYKENVILVGNIGQPCLDHYDEINENTKIVYEMSCHQLMHTKTSPKIAVFLNLYEDHLDYYKTVEKYFYAKRNITKYQLPGDTLFVGNDVPELETKADVVHIQVTHKFRMSILGEHNQFNAECVYDIACNLFHLKKEDVLTSISEYKGLPHRIEYIGTVDDVLFYDDSISTIPEATIKAIKSIHDIHTILIGGMDRKIDYTLLVDFIKENQELTFLCAYESGQRIYHETGESPNCVLLGNLEQAVSEAKKITPKGKACVLSPAAASYGYFKNFEERGDVYKEYVMK